MRRTLKPNQLAYIEGDTKPALLGTIENDDGTPVNIAGYGFALHIDYAVPKVVAGGISDAPNGKYIIQWGAGDLLPGRWRFEIQITDASGGILTINRHNENDELLELIIDPQVA